MSGMIPQTYFDLPNPKVRNLHEFERQKGREKTGAAARLPLGDEIDKETRCHLNLSQRAIRKGLMLAGGFPRGLSMLAHGR